MNHTHPTRHTHPARHPAVRHPHASLNDQVGDRISAAFGSMRTFWLLVAWQLAWMTLATVGVPLLKKDPYPFTFCLFLSNLIQLWALPVLGNTQNRADVKRNLKADTDHQALTHIARTVDRAVWLLEQPHRHGAAAPADTAQLSDPAQAPRESGGA